MQIIFSKGPGIGGLARNCLPKHWHGNRRGDVSWNPIRLPETFTDKIFPESRPDATDLDPNELPDFDLLCAGFPCQTFSVAGKRAGFDDPRGVLFLEIAKVARAKRSRYLLLENVQGILCNFERWVIGS